MTDGERRLIYWPVRALASPAVCMIGSSIGPFITRAHRDGRSRQQGAQMACLSCGRGMQERGRGSSVGSASTRTVLLANFSGLCRVQFGVRGDARTHSWRALRQGQKCIPAAPGVHHHAWRSNTAKMLQPSGPDHHYAPHTSSEGAYPPRAKSFSMPAIGPAP